MKFNRLILNNIGAFYGNNEFDLTTPSKEQNIVLFGGKNGSGKTTILDSIKIVLFGAFAYGLKTESTSYIEKIESKLNNLAKKSNHGLFQIILELEMVENYKRNHYTLNRSWSKNRNSYKEDFTVIKNGKRLDDREVELFQTKLRDETPPQLLDFCLFDGEKISQVVNKELLSTYLRETAKVMFNLDLFERLEKDIETYLKQEKVYTSLSDEEKQLVELEIERNKLEKELSNLKLEYSDIEKELDDKISLYNDLNRQFEVNGGLKKKERDALVKKISDIENHRMNLMEKNREVITTIFPFILGRDLLSVVIEQMNKEAKNELRNEFESAITPDDFMRLLSPYIYKGRTSDINEVYDQLTMLLSDEEIKPIHKASSIQRTEIMALYKRLVEFNPLDMSNAFKENAKLLKELRRLRKKLEENDLSSDLKELLDKTKEVQNEITSLGFRKEQIKVMLKDLEDQIEKKELEYNKLRHKIISSKKTGHVFEIASKVTEVSRLFREMQLKKKLQQVELESARMLQQIYRKELFVTRVKINPKYFELRIFDVNQEEINIDTLSAGEKQILFLSTIWAMAMCSRRRLPFVFDTLLGRLDQTHKNAIMQRFIPQCGEQVIILATDSEISKEQFVQIESRIAQCYTIEYDTVASKVQINNDYFGMESKYELSSKDI